MLMGRRVLRIVGWMLGLLILFIGGCAKDKGDIEGTVRNGVTMDPLSGVTVSMDPSGDSDQTDQNGNFGFYDLRVGWYTVHYRMEGFQDAEQPVQVKKDAVVRADMGLHPTEGRITGTIIDSITEEKLSGVHVWIEGGPSDNSSVEGTYVLEVQEGKYLVHYRKEGYQDGVSDREITVEGGKETQADYQLRPLKGIVYGRITDAQTGTGVAGVSITATPGIGSLTSDADGTYRTDPIPIGSYMVSFKATDYKEASKNVRLQPGDRIRVDVQLEPSPSPKVTITRGPEDGATLSTSEVTFGWEG
ncbi:MAG TPA: hypothetical protein EYP17_10650, partial [Candidatus Latescibacteria bacterium]|nr:hypothetical protein [Candidatus Latescibacterota bacterium]